MECAPDYLPCSRCDAPRSVGGRYCLACHAAYMREWRKTHKLSEAARLKDIARSIAGVYKRRGHLTQQPCESCGSTKSQMHHEDYTKPLDVTWLCRPCHLAHHRAEKAVVHAIAA